MSFLTLNNIVIPTADPTADRVVKEYGERSNAFDGTYQIDVRSRKRIWTFKTKPVPPIQARMLRGLIMGQQVYAPYDSSVYTSAGLGANAGGSTITIRNSVAPVAPFTVLDENGQPEAKVGAGSLTVQRSVSNLLTSAQAEASSLTPFSNWGAGTTSSLVTSRYLSGTNCIQFVPGGSGGGVFCNNGSAGGNTITGNIGDTIIVSGYVSGTTGDSVLIYIIDAQHSTTLASQAATIVSGAWTRIVLKFTLVASSTDLRWQIGGTASGHNYFVDCIQMEKVATGNPTLLYAGSWQPGGTTLSAGALSYNGSGMMGHAGITLSAWATRPPGLQTEILGGIQISGGAYSFLVFNKSNGTLEVDCVGRNQTSFGTLNESYSWDNNWHLITATLNLSPSGSDAHLYLYADTTLLGSLTVPNAGYLPTPSQAVNLNIGHLNGANWWGGRIDEVQVLPFPVDATWVAGTYGLPAIDNTAYPNDIVTLNAGFNASSYPDGAAAPTPFLYAAGSAIDAATALVMGQVTKEEFIGVNDQAAAAWRPNSVIMDFTLTEV